MTKYTIGRYEKYMHEIHPTIKNKKIAIIYKKAMKFTKGRGKILKFQNEIIRFNDELHCFEFEDIDDTNNISSLYYLVDVINTIKRQIEELSTLVNILSIRNIKKNKKYIRKLVLEKYELKEIIKYLDRFYDEINKTLRIRDKNFYPFLIYTYSKIFMVDECILEFYKKN